MVMANSVAMLILLLMVVTNGGRPQAKGFKEDDRAARVALRTLPQGLCALVASYAPSLPPSSPGLCPPLPQASPSCAPPSPAT